MDGRTSRRSSRRSSRGAEAGLVARRRRSGIVVGDRASDQIALNDYLLPDFKAGRPPAPVVVETMPAQTSEQAQMTTDAPLDRGTAGGRWRPIGHPTHPVQRVLPLPAGRDEQKYYPKLLLSDYEDTIEIALGLIPVPF